MSVLVELKENATPHSGRSHQDTPPSSTGAKSLGKGKARAREPQQKVNKLKSSADSVAPGGTRGGAERMNRIAVERVDGDVRDILSTVPQVVLYQYEADSNTWERTSTEGTLFIYSRMTAPSHGFVLLNRLSSDNLLEMVQPGSEYRVQGQFVLFKKQSDASKVFGLCFSDCQVSSTTGQLLNSLSSPAVAIGNGRHAGRSAPISVSMRSQSVPSFHHSQGGGSNLLGDRVDIMELLENAGNSYLNQAFSDETGSSGQESPPTDGISFSAHPLSLSLLNDRGQPPIGDKTPPTHKRHVPIKRHVPRLVNMSTTPPSTSPSHPPPSSQAVGPPSHLVQSQVQYSSRVASSASKPTPTSSSRASSDAPAAGQLTPRGDGTRNPMRSSTAPGPTGRRKLHVPPPTRGIGGGGSAHRPSPQGLTSGLLHEVVPEKPSARHPPTREPAARERGNTISSTTVTAAESSKGVTHMETLFSQSLPTPLLPKVGGVNGSPALSGTKNRTPPTQPMSLAEVEKQMKEEVPSPDKIPRQFAMFPLHPSLSNLSSPPSPAVTTSPGTLPTPPTSAPGNARGGDEPHLLRQPSSFSAATPPSRANTTPLVTRSTASTVCATTPLPSSGKQASIATGSVQLNIEPPSPVVTTWQPHKGLMNWVFPEIPPLMHSPGMRAPPVSRGPHMQTDSLQENGTRDAHQQGGRESRGRTGEGGGRSRRGRRSPGKTGSPVGAGSGKSPSPQIDDVATAVAVGLAETPPTRSWSVPGNMSPDVSVVVPSQPATQPHTLLSPQQFSLSETPPPAPQTHTPPPADPDPQCWLSREQLKQALLHLIQNDEEFVGRIHQAYRVSRQSQ